jgi:hypothetical protein
MKRSNINILIAVSLVLVAIIVRIASSSLHLYNFAPIAALGLFSGAVIKDKRLLALLVPLAGQFLADLYFQVFTNTPGFYPGQFFNYLALGSAAALGLSMKQIKPVSVLAYIFGASALFFVISNFGVFMSGYYSYSFAGFIETYVKAIPFYRNTILGDLIGGVALFGLYFTAQSLFIKKAQKVSI